MTIWIPGWLWAVSVGYGGGVIFGAPKPTTLGAITLASTVWLASPWGRAAVWFMVRPGGQVVGSALAAGAARAGPAYAAAFAESFPSVSAASRRAWGSRLAAAVFNPYTTLGALAVGGTLAQVNVMAKHGSGVRGTGTFGVAPSKHLEGGKPWWN